MTKYPYKQIGTGFREGRNDINQNMLDIESDMRELGAGAVQAIEAADEANTQAEYANDRGDYADERGDYAGEQGDYAKAQGNYAKSQGDYGKAQGDYAKSVADTNKNQWKTPVANFAAIATTYPNPVLGDRVVTLDDNKEYRYQNGAWEFVTQYTSSGLADLQARLAETGKTTQSLNYGLNVVNGDVNSPATVDLKGRTLTSLGNTPLFADTNYVLADKKAKVIVDGTTYSGVSKFRKGTGTQSDRAIIIRVANFEGKVSGSTVENPNISKRAYSSTLLPPSSFVSESTSSEYPKYNQLDGILQTYSTLVNGQMAEDLKSFDIISIIERNVGTIPKSTLAEKVQWVKDNVARLTGNWWGFGSSVGGNKATLSVYKISSGSWLWATTNTSGVVTKIAHPFLDGRTNGIVSDFIDASGFVHYLAYAEASDGTTPSTINTDYIELEIELKPTANFQNPKVALYEVGTQAHYDAILTTWSESEVINRYPIVQGTQHIQNPAIMAEGENLLPPFTEWTLHANATVKSPNEFEINATGIFQGGTISIPVVGGQSYAISVITTLTNSYVDINWKDKDGLNISNSPRLVYPSTSIVVVAPSNARSGTVNMMNEIATTGKFTFKNPMLNLGTTAKPFTPRNPSYLFPKVKLGQIGTVQDELYADDGVYKVRKVIEKEVVLDGSLTWLHQANGSGWKNVRTTAVNNSFATQIMIGTKFDGKTLFRRSVADYDQIDITTALYIGVINTDSGFADTYTPTSDEWKAYFYGWTAKTVDGTGKPTAWKSLGDGTDAPTQTLAYVSTTKAPNYTPYKLSYVLATPKIDVADVEGALTVNGLTQVNVDSGLIVREKVTPQKSGTINEWYINEKGIYSSVDSPFFYKPSRILNVYKNGIIDNKWIFYANQGNQNGLVLAKTTDFDPTAEYTVTYLVLDKSIFTTNPIDTTISFSKGIRDALDDTVIQLQDNTTAISVSIQAIAELYKRVKALGG